jgi:hypothetical protein
MAHNHTAGNRTFGFMMPAGSSAPLMARDAVISSSLLLRCNHCRYGFCANEAWVAVSLIAGALLAWSQMTCLGGALAKAEPKPMCYRALRVAILLVHRGRDLILRLDETWPWASELATAFTRLRAAFP